MPRSTYTRHVDNKWVHVPTGVEWDRLKPIQKQQIIWARRDPKGREYRSAELLGARRNAAFYAREKWKKSYEARERRLKLARQQKQNFWHGPNGYAKQLLDKRRRELEAEKRNARRVVNSFPRHTGNTQTQVWDTQPSSFPRTQPYRSQGRIIPSTYPDRVVIPSSQPAADQSIANRAAAVIRLLATRRAAAMERLKQTRARGIQKPRINGRPKPNVMNIWKRKPSQGASQGASQEIVWVPPGKTVRDVMRKRNKK